jgi:hypothetical protein
MDGVPDCPRGNDEPPPLPEAHAQQPLSLQVDRLASSHPIHTSIFDPFYHFSFCIRQGGGGLSEILLLNSVETLQKSLGKMSSLSGNSKEIGSIVDEI